MVAPAGILRPSNGSKPTKISQIPNKIIPKLPVTLRDLKPPASLAGPSRIRMPAAMARMANRVSPPGMLILSSGNRPVRISQIASKIIPKLLEIFISMLL